MNLKGKILFRTLVTGCISKREGGHGLDSPDTVRGPVEDSSKHDSKP